MFSVFLTWVLYPTMIILIIRWLDKKFLKGSIAFNLPFIAFYLITSVLVTGMIPFFLVFNRADCVNSKRGVVLLRQLSHLVGVRWVVRGTEVMSREEGCVIVVNHQSSLDVLGMFWIWRHFNRMAAIAKKELFYVWPFGLAAYLAGVVYIDRLEPNKAKQQLTETSRLMTEDKTKLLLFPEGTRSKSRGIQPFKKGAFHMAIACQAPIMPIVYSPYFYIIKQKKYFERGGRVIIEALPLVPTTGLSLEDVDMLKDKVHALMLDKYEQLTAELRAGLPPNHPGLEL